MKRKIIPYLDFEFNLKFNPNKRIGGCDCGNELIRFSLREQWICVKCKKVYEISIIKVQDRELGQEGIKYIEEFLKNEYYR